MMAQRFDIDHATDVGRDPAVFLAADDLPAIIDDERLTAKGIDRLAGGVELTRRLGWVR